MISVLSPVKINLFLHITGKRNDGYHLLQTIFQFLQHGDVMEFEIHFDGRLQRIDEHDYHLPETDLCIQAAMLLREATEKNALGATITLKKKIAPGSGLGAGSSNAATTLMVLNHLWQTELSREQLMEIGAELGADVPIFIYGHSAWAEGIGDQLTPCEPSTPWYVVTIPQVHVATAQVFGAPALKRNHPTVTWQDFEQEGCINTLEPTTTSLFPQVAEVITFLNQYGKAKMSGTGAAVFVPMEDVVSANAVVSATPTQWHSFVARGTNISPLHTTLNNL